MRTTRKTLDALLVILAKQLGVESGRYEKDDDGRYRPVPGLMIGRYAPGGRTYYRVTELHRGTRRDPAYADRQPRALDSGRYLGA